MHVIDREYRFDFINAVKSLLFLHLSQMSSQIPAGLNIVDVVNALIREMPNENPLKYLENMYDSLSPAFINFGIATAKEKAKSLNNKKGTKEVNIYFQMGTENVSKSRISGFFSGILFIEDYVRSKGPTMGITPSELKTFTDVLRRAGLPTLADAYKPEGVTYTTKTYEALLSAWLVWMSRSSVANRQGATVSRSNKEVCDVLTSSSLGTFPAIPFTSFYIGTIKTNEDIPTLAEKMYKGTKFDKYISDEFSAINEPKFVVASSNAPVTSLGLHPLVFNVTGIPDSNSNNVEWWSGFSQSNEFAKICMKNNLTPKQIAIYMLSTSIEQHKRNIESKNPIALFIKEQKIMDATYELLRKSDGLLKLRGPSEENYLG